MTRLHKTKHISGICIARENGLASLPGINLWFASGRLIASSRLPEQYLKTLDDRYGKYLVWDVQYDQRIRAFNEIIANAPHTGYARLDDDTAKPLGMAWVHPSSNKARCGEIHFTFNDNRMPLVKAATLAFMAYLQDHYDALFGLIPASFRHVIKFGETLGFKKTAKLKNACWLETRKRHDDGILLYKEF